MSQTLAVALCACLLPNVAAFDDEPPQDDVASDEMELQVALPLTHSVQRGELVVAIRSNARLQAGETAKVVLTPEVYTGAFEIASIERAMGRVQAGQTLLHLDDEPWRKQLRDAELSLEETTERLAFEKQELEVMQQANATRLERAAKALADAELALELWETFHGERMLRAADLSTRQRESGVLNQREELAQLQAMYEGAELESATKEIVLERAVRGLAIAEQWLEIVREDERITRDYTHGQRARDVRDEVRYREEALAHARVQTAIGEARKQRTVQQVARSLDEATTRLEGLKRDEALFVVTAPIGGLLARIDREAGDRVNARQVVAELHDDSFLRLTFDASPNQLRVLREGDEVTVRVPELPEVVMVGTIELIEPIGRATGETTHFAVEVRIDEPHELARIGLGATVERDASLGEVLLVPHDAVTWEKGKAFVELLDGDLTIRREVTIGASNEEMHQVVEGLDVGDLVVVAE